MAVKGLHDIQVVVPIYNAYHSTKDCLASLYKHNSDNQVILIDDASSDQRIKDLIKAYCSKTPHWVHKFNSENQGFVKTANRGLKSSAGDTILLNADTIVSSGWLEKMQLCESHVSNLATATPWSNNAEICSLPKNLQNNPMPQDIDQLAQEIDQHHSPQYPEIPTAVGFCMMITAHAKKRVGYFNESVFGHGYGEENDYSLRATEAGLRNVLVDNAYVAHVGNQSFAEKGLRPNKQTMGRLLALHPNYAEQIDAFIKNDPLAPIRHSITDKIETF